MEKTDVNVEIASLKQNMHDLEWRSRIHNLELHGIHISKNEDLTLRINEVAKHLDMPDLASDQITAAHRLRQVKTKF